MANERTGPLQLFLIFLRLGLTSFGGPIAHLAYFRVEFVERREWFSEQAYADLLALCQFLPGPASSQVGLAIGLSRAGYSGALAAWLGFTLPSAIALILFATSLTHNLQLADSGLVHGLKLVAVAVIAQAIWGMARSLCPDRTRITLLFFSTSVVLLFPAAWTQLLVILVSALFGLMWFKPENTDTATSFDHALNRKQGTFWLILFALLLFGLPVISTWSPSPTLALADSFYRSGSLVFGGGHVVLPLLQAEVVPGGLVAEADFLAGYGAAQAVPGPLFTFAAFLGAVTTQGPTGWLGGTIALTAIFLPAFLLIAGVLPFWTALKSNRSMRAALMGVNAAVVGLLLSTLFTPVWTSTVSAPLDFIIALGGFIALIFWKLPPWAVVLVFALLGWFLY